MARRRKLTALDLFSGCGGLTLGLKQAGFRVVGAVEVDDLAVETYRSNHPRIPVWHADIRRLSATAVVRGLNLKRGSLDLLAGCPPCQGFSTITTLNGKYRATDPRNDLLFDFLRFVRAMRPRAVMMENVPRIARNEKLKQCLRALRKLGYEVNHDILDASNYGVPQRRRRFILLAGMNIAPEFAAEARKNVSVATAIRHLGNRRRHDPLHGYADSRSPKVAALIKRIPKNGGSRSALGSRAQLDCHKSFDGFKDVYGRMAWNDVAPTITSGCFNPSKGRFLHPSRDRCITMREAALLQSFPISYKFSLRRGKTGVAEMIGNALPPEFIRRHATKVGSYLRQSNSPADGEAGR